MKIYDAKGTNEPFPIGIIVSRFNQDVTKLLLDGAVKRLKELGFNDEDISIAWVPGAVEIPIAAQRMAQWGTQEALICLGAVIQGETDHHLYVSQQVSQGCQHVSLQNDIPILFGVLTTKTEEQANERAGGKHGNKGAETVDAAVETVALLRLLQ